VIVCITSYQVGQTVEVAQDQPDHHQFAQLAHDPRQFGFVARIEHLQQSLHFSAVERGGVIILQPIQQCRVYFEYSFRITTAVQRSSAAGR